MLLFSIGPNRGDTVSASLSLLILEKAYNTENDII
jgi:hypothetical protein